MYHPPAAGGKTAWGVDTTRSMDDPLQIEKARIAKMDYAQREEERLQRLKRMDFEAGGILEARKSRRETFEVSKTSGGDDWKRKNDDILKKMTEAKEQKKLEKKRMRAESGQPVAGKQKRRKKENKKKQKKEASSSSSESEDSSSASSSSESAAEKKAKASELEAAAEEIAVVQAPLDPEAKKRAEEARARKREVKRKAAEQAAAWAAEVKRKEAEAELQRQAEAKRKAEEAVEKKKAEQAKKKAEEEARRKEDEAKAKLKAVDSEARKDLFKSGSSRSVGDTSKGSAEKSDLMIGGFRQGQTVYATKNITVKSIVVVKMNTPGKIIGPSENNPMQRIAVQFSRREDRMQGNMNVVTAEIKKSLR